MKPKPVFSRRYRNDKGELHRLAGPAVIHSEKNTNIVKFFINGRQLTRKQWKKWLRDHNLILISPSDREKAYRLRLI